MPRPGGEPALQGLGASRGISRKPRHSLLSLLCQGVLVLRYHPGREDRHHHDPPRRAATRPLPRSPLSQAHLLSRWSLRPLGSLHSRKPNDTL